MPEKLQEGIPLGGQGEHIIQLRDLALPIQNPILRRIAVQKTIGEMDHGIDAHRERHGNRGRPKIKADLSRSKEEHGHRHLQRMGDFFKNNPDEFTFDTENKKGEKAFTKFDGGNGKAPKGFYRYSRQSFKAKADLTGKIAENFFWEAGYTFYWINHKEFTPEGYTTADGSLYGLYKEWGILNDTGENQFVSALKAGLMYDSRDVENNPTKGIWAEAHAIAAPKWLGSSMESYKISATFRHYVPIVHDKLTFAYRLAYQGFLGKNTPWYLMPFYSNMGYNRDFDAIGGYRTTRGLMLDRVQGLHTGFYNIELRYKFIDFQLWNQNIAFALSAFTDGAHVFKGYDLTNKTGVKQDLYKKYIDSSRKDGLHATAGAGLRFIMNQNFIVAFEYARCFNKQDGTGAFYINTGFLF